MHLFSLQFYLLGDRWGFVALLCANPTGQTCDLRGHTVLVQLNMGEKTVQIPSGVFPDKIYEENRKVFLKARILFSDSCFYKSHPTAYTIILMSPLCNVTDVSGSPLALGKKGHQVTVSPLLGANPRYLHQQNLLKAQPP